MRAPAASATRCGSAQPGATRILTAALAGVVLGLAACAPASPPAATSTPPAASPAPAKPAAAPSPAPAAPKPSPPGVASPPAASASPAAKPASSPAASPASAAFNEQAVADFYRGKTVRLIIGAPPGGGYDTYGRVIARQLSKYIPGNPIVIAENLAGAGSILALKQIYGTFPKDGTVIGNIIAQNVASDQMFNNPTDYDLTKLAYLGAPGADSFAFFIHERTGIKSLDELIGPNAKEITIGSVSPTGDPGSAAAAYLNTFFNAKIKNVSGYAGTAPIRLAIDQGEVDGYVNAWQSHIVTSKEKTDSGEWLIVLQVSMDPIPGIPSSVPTLRDVAKTPEQAQMARLITLPNEFARPYFVAPGVPADRTAALRQAFQRTLADPDLKAEAARANLTLAPIAADKLESMINEFLSVSDATKAQLKPILTP